MDCCLKTQGVPQISSDEKDRKIFGFEIFDSGNFGVGKIRQVFFGWLDLNRDFFKYLKQISEDSC